MCRKHTFHASFHRKAIITLGDDCAEAIEYSKKQLDTYVELTNHTAENEEEAKHLHEDKEDDCDEESESDAELEDTFPLDATETQRINSFKKDIAFQKGKPPESVFELLYRRNLKQKIINVRLQFNKGYQI